MTLGPCSNGNMTGSTGVQVRVQSWTDFNQPDTLSYRGKSVAFSYDAGYKRVKEITTDGATVRTLFLVHPDNVGGLGFEREETRVSGGVTRNESRHYISVGGSVIAVVKTLNDSGTVSTDVNLTNYWHKDGLGSIVAVTNVSGAVLERMAYDAWGRRQRDTGRVDPDLDPANGNRGFTGHEHLDELALIHMNGRVYDPFLGRFLSADPIIEAEHLLQSYNRYSYVLNNPLRYTDPSGHCIDFCITAGLAAVMAVAGTALMVEGNTYWRMVGAIMTAYAIGPGGLAEAGLAQAGVVVTKVGASAIAGAYVGLVSSGGDLSAAIQGAVFAAAFTTVGGSGLGDGAKVAAHALIGCLQGAASGGKCGPSAMAAAFGKFATNNIPAGFDPLGAVVTAIAGGTASVIGGGKFASGALQAGFGYLFNYCTQPTVACLGEKALNVAKFFGGGLQTAAGVALCTTVVACIGGGVVSVVGASQVIQSVTYWDNPDIDGFNPVKQAFQGVAVRFGGTATAGASLYHLTEVVTGFGAMAAPVTATTGWTSMGTRGPMTRSYGSISYPSFRLEQAGRAAIGINIGSGAAKVYNTLRPEPQ